MGEQGALSVEQFCGAAACEGLRVTTLGTENLCCDHFVGRCYALLERIDPDSSLREASGVLSQEIRQTVEECSRRVLELSLGEHELTNLQRARLLDILLWASDISSGANSRLENPWGLTKTAAEQ